MEASWQFRQHFSCESPSSDCWNRLGFCFVLPGRHSSLQQSSGASEQDCLHSLCFKYSMAGRISSRASRLEPVGLTAAIPNDLSWWRQHFNDQWRFFVHQVKVSLLLLDSGMLGIYFVLCVTGSGTCTVAVEKFASQHESELCSDLKIN